MPDDHVVRASGFPLGASRKMLEEDVNGVDRGGEA
jgi:hypothetical protein